MYQKLLLLASVVAVTLMGMGCGGKDVKSGNTNPLGPNGQQLVTDIDGDGIFNVADDDIDGDGIANDLDNDIDGDNTLNVNDTDIDGDGVDNIDDNDLDGDGIINTLDPDTDGDGTANNLDTDLDGDGVVNTNDQDIDGDGIVNGQDGDIDGDGISNANDPVVGGPGNVITGTGGTSNTGTDQNGGQTDDNSGAVSGVVVEASHDESFDLNITSTVAGNITSRTEIVDLNEMRTEVNDNEIDLPTAYIKSMTATSDPSCDAYVAANAAAKYVLQIYFKTSTGNKVLIMTSPTAASIFPMRTLGELKNGIALNQGLYVSMPGYGDFVSTIKNEQESSIEMIAELTMVDVLTVNPSPYVLKLNIQILIAGKKKI